MTGGQEGTSLNEWAVDQYDAVSKALFDARDNVALAKTLGTAHSFNAGVVQIMADAGIPTKFLKGLAGEDVGTTEWKAAIEQVADAGAELALETAIGGFLTAIGAPQWIPGTVGAVHKVQGYFNEVKANAANAKLELLSSGQWVLINNGPVPGPEVGYKEGLGGRRRLWGSWTDTGPPPDQISSGFYVGSASGAGYVTVFNFFNFKKEDHRLANVAMADAKKTTELNQDPILAKVRDLFFSREEPSAKMVSSVPTDPGTEVIYKKLLYHIVKAEGRSFDRRRTRPAVGR